MVKIIMTETTHQELPDMFLTDRKIKFFHVLYRPQPNGLICRVLKVSSPIMLGLSIFE